MYSLFHNFKIVQYITISCNLKILRNIKLVKAKAYFKYITDRLEANALN